MALDFSKTSGKYTGDQRTTNWVSNMLQDQLDNKSLAQAVAGKLITPMKFVRQTTNYHGADGTESHERIVFRTKEGDIILSSKLGPVIKDWFSNLGDLQLRRGISNRDGVTPYFRLQMPGGGVTIDEDDISEDSAVTKEESMPTS